MYYTYIYIAIRIGASHNFQLVGGGPVLGVTPFFEALLPDTQPRRRTSKVIIVLAFNSVIMTSEANPILQMTHECINFQSKIIHRLKYETGAA